MFFGFLKHPSYSIRVLIGLCFKMVVSKLCSMDIELNSIEKDNGAMRKV